MQDATRLQLLIRKRINYLFMQPDCKTKHPTT